MKEEINQWLAANVKQPGILGLGVRYSDRSSYVLPCVPGIEAAALENACRCISDTYQVLKISFLKSKRVRWVYDGGVVDCAQREDGTCLGILSDGGQPGIEPVVVNRLLEEFCNLS
jgi:hypothetical protein